jgi:MFS family permease
MTADTAITAVPDPRRWLALALLAVAQFVVVLDASIMNIALPSIGTELQVSQERLSWIINGYVLTFGGFLLLGGRLADLLGRRRVFVAGLVLFAAASLAGGLATSSSQLIAARAVQGLGGALLAPAALSILTTIFAAGAERNKYERRARATADALEQLCPRPASLDRARATRAQVWHRAETAVTLSTSASGAC